MEADTVNRERPISEWVTFGRSTEEEPVTRKKQGRVTGRGEPPCTQRKATSECGLESQGLRIKPSLLSGYLAEAVEEPEEPEPWFL